MKKVVGVLILLLSLIWFKSYLGQKPETRKSSGTTKNTQVDQVETLDTHLVPEVKKEIKAPVSDFESKMNSEENVSLSQPEYEVPTEKTPEQLAQEKLKIPIREELKKATPFTAWSSSDSFFTGIYRGQVKIKGKNYLIRMNLMFDGANDDITPSTCAAMYGPEKAIFRETYGNGNISFLRTKDAKYIILSVSDRFYFQIFQTNSGKKRSFRTHLTVRGERAPFVFYLNELPQPDTLDECKL